MHPLIGVHYFFKPFLFITLIHRYSNIQICMYCHIYIVTLGACFLLYIESGFLKVTKIVFLSTDLCGFGVVYSSPQNLFIPKYINLFNYLNNIALMKKLSEGKILYYFMHNPNIQIDGEMRLLTIHTKLANKQSIIRRLCYLVNECNWRCVFVKVFNH